MFFGCQEISYKWALTRVLTRGTTLELLVGPNLFESIRVAVMKHRRCPAQLILLVEILQATWTERCLAAFQRPSFTFPLDHVIRHALLQVEALVEITINPKKRRTLEKLRVLLCSLLDRYVRHYSQQLVP